MDFNKLNKEVNRQYGANNRDDNKDIYLSLPYDDMKDLLLYADYGKRAEFNNTRLEDELFGFLKEHSELESIQQLHEKWSVKPYSDKDHTMENFIRDILGVMSDLVEARLNK